MTNNDKYRVVKNPQISARYLADYMHASEQRKRTLIRDCKYQAIARVIQHDEAKAIITNFIRSKEQDVSRLTEKATDIRDRWTDDNFQRDLFDHNADYIERFANVFPNTHLPDVEFLQASRGHIILGGVKVTADIQFGLRRTTKTNKVKIGAATYRYAKGKALAAEVGLWQSSFLWGYVKANDDGSAEAENRLCLTIDAYSGVAYQAPTDALTRYKNMEAACFSIAERWNQIEEPK